MKKRENLALLKLTEIKVAIGNGESGPGVAVPAYISNGVSRCGMTGRIVDVMIGKAY